MTVAPVDMHIATQVDEPGGSLERPAAAPYEAPFARHSKAPATWEAYRRDWAQWEAWLVRTGVRPDDATGEHVAAWCAHLADEHKASTVARKVSSLGALYRFMGRRSPTRTDVVRTTLAGIRRAKGTARKQARPLTADLVRQVVADLDADRPADCRDAALLLVGFALAGRRSELVALDVEHVEFVHGGMRILIAKSKTDQTGEGATVGVPTGASAATCPVAWLRRWLAVAGITAGPIFRMVDAYGNFRDDRLSAQSVCLIVKRHAARVGLDRASYSAHSLRAGLATSAASGGAATLRIADHGRWRSLNVLQGYVRDAQALDDGNPLRATGL